MDRPINPPGPEHKAELQVISQLEHLLPNAENLITKLDTHHRGFVTAEELSQACNDKSAQLSPKEKETAAEMLKWQYELRSERVGCLPALAITHAGSAENGACFATAIAPESMGGKPVDRNTYITRHDLQSFETMMSTTKMVLDLESGTAKQFVSELVKTYGHDGELSPHDVWKAVSDLETSVKKLSASTEIESNIKIAGLETKWLPSDLALLAKQQDQLFLLKSMQQAQRGALIEAAALAQGGQLDKSARLKAGTVIKEDDIYKLIRDFVVCSQNDWLSDRIFQPKQ